MDELEVRAFPDAASFETWLSEHHATSSGVWVKMARSGTGIPSVTVDELVDAGLCWGWISGQRRSLDDTFYLQKYGRRRPRSLWSQVNVDKVAALTAAGRMRPPGQAEVDAAKSDGRWAAAYESQKNATTPPDLESALAADLGARQRFDSLTKSQRYSIIHPLLTAKTEKTRANRLAKAMANLSSNETHAGSADRSYELPP
jgi:uncharacterized protein YdeI (YjbR/CyaY-like superfamily)